MADILKIKKYLSCLDYPIYDITENLDERTKKSITAFQNNLLLPITSEITDEFMNTLISQFEKNKIQSAQFEETREVPEFPPDTPRILKLGMEEPEVKQLKSLLAKLGIYKGPINEIFDEETERAVLEFQKQNKLREDGEVGPGTWRNLLNYFEPTLKLGSNDFYVRELELVLQKLGYFDEAPDEYFSEKTEEAVKKFQSDNGLTADGIVGPNTWNKLEDAFNPEPVLPRGQLPTLILGSTGKYVELLQLVLTELGYFDGTIDGYLGKETSAAVRDFETKSGLTANGVVDKVVWDALNSELKDPSLNKNLVKENDTGLDVKILQKLLKRKGYFTGSVTGSFDHQTTNALKAFQKAFQLISDGKAGPLTWDALYGPNPRNTPDEPLPNGPKPTLRYGDEGIFVKELQQELKDLLYYNGRISGYFEENTLVAVKSFQDANKLIADGIVGRSTWYALYSLYPPPVICD